MSFNHRGHYKTYFKNRSFFRKIASFLGKKKLLRGIKLLYLSKIFKVYHQSAVFKTNREKQSVGTYQKNQQNHIHISPLPLSTINSLRLKEHQKLEKTLGLFKIGRYMSRYTNRQVQIVQRTEFPFASQSATFTQILLPRGLSTCFLFSLFNRSAHFLLVCPDRTRRVGPIKANGTENSRP